MVRAIAINPFGYGKKSIATYTENGGILRQRAFLRKYIEIIKTLNCTTLNQCTIDINQVSINYFKARIF